MQTPQTLNDFSIAHGGVKAVIRRHFAYRNLVPTQQAMVYTRDLDAGKLGLNASGVRGALMQGERLGAWQIVSTVIYGRDQRNFEGAHITAEVMEEVIKKPVARFEDPGVTYPVYKNISATDAAMKEYGDPFVHRILAGNIANLWTESPKAFYARIIAAIENAEGAALWDLNFEAMVVLYYHYIARIQSLAEIPFDGTAWIPTKGGGIVLARDGTVALFDPNLEIVP
jgi:hypothetical protein